LISQDGTVIRQKAEGISRMGRATQGVRVMNLRDGDRLSSIARVTEPQGDLPVGEQGDEPVEIDLGDPETVDAAGADAVEEVDEEQTEEPTGSGE
jgi:DNA gyrase subunit A